MTVNYFAVYKALKMHQLGTHFMQINTNIYQTYKIINYMYIIFDLVRETNNKYNIVTITNIIISKNVNEPCVT